MNSLRPSRISLGETVLPSEVGRLPRRSPKDRSQFLGVLRKHIQAVCVDTNAAVLVIGGTQEDAEVLRHCGFHDITLSNITGASGDSGASSDLPLLAVDAENLQLPDSSYDVVFVHEVLHHCRCPHMALCEMLRVAKTYVILMEPNDSVCMKLLCKMRLSFPYELAAVVDNDYARGGVRNSPIPNFIYRWSKYEIYKSVSSFLAERMFRLHADPYWDFNTDEKDLAYREQTRLSVITRVIGSRNFIRLLRYTQRCLNTVAAFRRQGNKFFCIIEKCSTLRPWLVLKNNGDIEFNRDFQQKPN